MFVPPSFHPTPLLPRASPLLFLPSISFEPQENPNPTLPFYAGSCPAARSSDSSSQSNSGTRDRLPQMPHSTFPLLETESPLTLRDIPKTVSEDAPLSHFPREILLNCFSALPFNGSLRKRITSFFPILQSLLCPDLNISLFTTCLKHFSKMIFFPP